MAPKNKSGFWWCGNGPNKQQVTFSLSFSLNLVYLLAVMLSPAVSDRQTEMNIAYPAHAFVAGPELGRFFSVT
jgi:hypothetical protein